MSDRYELLQYLKTVECEEYIDLFVANDIKIDLLPQLDRHALKEIGITKVGDRLRLQVLIHLLNTERLKSRVNVSDLAEVVSNASATLNSVDKTVTYNDKARRSSATFKVENEYKNCVTIIGPDGHKNEVNVTGCFSSTSIKRKAVRKMGISATHVEEWKAYYVDEDNNLHMMFDAEFTALCHSPDRPEKKRIILCHASESPSEAALATSKSILASGGTETKTLKNFLGQRPPSQLISTNLGEYFPDTGATELREVMRNSVRFSMYSSKMSTQQSTRESIYSGRPQSIASSVFSYGVAVPVKHTVGDVILNHSAAMDTIRADQPPHLEGEGTIRASTRNVSLEKNGSLDSKQRARMSVAVSMRENRDSTVIKLFDDEDDDESFDSSEQLSFSLENNDGPSVWHKGTKIGQGSFGTVYLGLNGLTGELMAVKQVSLPRSSEDSKQKMVNALKQELSLLRVMNHENIVRYLGSSADSDNIYIFLEYIPGGSVSSMLSTYGPFEEPLVRNFVTQVLIGLKYLHGEDIIHRDIKGANILIDIDGTVKISDFGISKKIDINDRELEDTGTTKQQKRASLQGSVYWMAPEVVKQIAYTDKADIWSLGCLIVEMLTGKHPYPGFSQMQAIFRIGTLTVPNIPDGITDDCRDFLTMTFETDYKKRCNAARLLKHPFITPLLTTKR